MRDDGFAPWERKQWMWKKETFLMRNKQAQNEQAVLIQPEEYLPETLFLNLRTQKIESIRPDQIAEHGQYILLSDLLAE